MRTAGLETAPPRAVRNCSKEAEGGESQYICDFGEGGVHVIKHLSLQKVFCESQGADVTTKGCSALLVMRIGLTKYLTI